jgi:hypothetical protein
LLEAFFQELKAPPLEIISTLKERNRNPRKEIIQKPFGAFADFVDFAFEAIFCLLFEK